MTMTTMMMMTKPPLLRDPESPEALMETPKAPYNFNKDSETTTGGTQPSTSSLGGDTTAPSSENASNVTMTPAKLESFKKALHDIFRENREASHMEIPDIMARANAMVTESFTRGEIDQCLSQMQDDNQVMVAENTVFLV